MKGHANVGAAVMFNMHRHTHSHRHAYNYAYAYAHACAAKHLPERSVMDIPYPETEYLVIYNIITTSSIKYYNVATSIIL